MHEGLYGPTKQDKCDHLVQSEFLEGLSFGHVVVLLFEMNKGLPLDVLDSFFKEHVDFLVKDDYGLTALDYAVSFVRLD